MRLADIARPPRPPAPLRVYVTHLYNTNGGCQALGDAPVYTGAFQNVLHEDEWRRTPVSSKQG